MDPDGVSADLSYSPPTETPLALPAKSQSRPVMSTSKFKTEHSFGSSLMTACTDDYAGSQLTHCYCLLSLQSLEKRRAGKVFCNVAVIIQEQSTKRYTDRCCPRLFSLAVLPQRLTGFVKCVHSTKN